MTNKFERKYTPEAIKHLEESEGTLSYVDVNRSVFSKTVKEKKKVKNIKNRWKKEKGKKKMEKLIEK